MRGAPDPAYVAARCVLLDALAALEPHLDSIILVGAQAVYMHAGEADIAVAPYTTDADIALDADSLKGEPLIEVVMKAAGFVSIDPGAWRGPGNVTIDLMVAAAQAGRGRRAARIPPHDKCVARKALGLEAALIDRDHRTVTALDEFDKRSYRMLIAGPAALIVAKTIKIDERRDQSNRLSDKDALDILRLLRALDSQEIAERMVRIESDARANAVATRATDLILDLFGSPKAVGCEMAVRATEGLMDPDEIIASLVALTTDLLSALDRLHRRSTTLVRNPAL